MFWKKWGISFSEYVAVKSRVQFNIWFKCKKSGISCKVRNEKQNSEQLHLKVEMKHRLNVEKTKHSFRLSLVKGIRNIVLDRSHKQDINNCFKRRKKGAIKRNSNPGSVPHFCTANHVWNSFAYLVSIFRKLQNYQTQRARTPHQNCSPLHLSRDWGSSKPVSTIDKHIWWSMIQ